MVRAADRIARAWVSRRNNPDEGWDPKSGAEHWAQVCGPTALTPYLQKFVRNEVDLRNQCKSLDAAEVQRELASLFQYVVRFGVPMERLRTETFREALDWSRNAEETLLATLEACALVTNSVSNSKFERDTEFGAWLRRIQGQIDYPPSRVVFKSMAYLDLSEATLVSSDLRYAH